MKCREGCEGAATVRPVCWKCWARVPTELKTTWHTYGWAAHDGRIEREIRDWLADDDKRRAE